MAMREIGHEADQRIHRVKNARGLRAACRPRRNGRRRRLLKIFDRNDAEEVARLAKMKPADYDRVRKEAAVKLGIRPATLDDEVKRARKGGDTGDAAGGRAILEDTTSVAVASKSGAGSDAARAIETLRRR
ncbi:MAG: hypothetical protein R3F10_06170 [Lysobacteraceae bacterium]